MMGSSVVPGLPNRRSTPSSRSSDRKADRPVMKFPPAAAALLIVPGCMKSSGGGSMARLPAGWPEREIQGSAHRASMHPRADGPEGRAL